MKKPCDSSQVMYCSDKIINAASNRYRLVEQVANRAKRSRYEDLDNFEDTTIKPVVRAILEMCDEAAQTRVVRGHSKCTSYSSRSHSNKDPNSNSSSNTPSNLSLEDSISSSENKNSNSVSFTNTPSNPTTISQRHTNYSDNKNLSLNYFGKNADRFAWKDLTEWLNSSLLTLDLDAAKTSAKRLKNNHLKKDNFSIATTLITHKAVQTAAVDLTRSIPHAEDIISGLINVELPTIAKLCTEMVYQISVIYEMDFRLSEQQAEVLTVLGRDIERFGTKVNWRGEPGWFDGAFSWHSYYQVTFDMNSVNGHLPAFWLEIAPGLPMRKGKIKNSLGVLLKREDINF